MAKMPNIYGRCSKICSLCFGFVYIVVFVFHLISKYVFVVEKLLTTFVLQSDVVALQNVIELLTFCAVDYNWKAAAIVQICMVERIKIARQHRIHANC